MAESQLKQEVYYSTVPYSQQQIDDFIDEDLNLILNENLWHEHKRNKETNDICSICKIPKDSIWWIKVKGEICVGNMDNIEDLLDKSLKERHHEWHELYLDGDIYTDKYQKHPQTEICYFKYKTPIKFVSPRDTCYLKMRRDLFDNQAFILSYRSITINEQIPLDKHCVRIIFKGAHMIERRKNNPNQGFIYTYIQHADGAGSIPKLFANFAQCDIMLNEINGIRKAMLNPISRPNVNEQPDKHQQSRFNKKLDYNIQLLQKEQSDKPGSSSKSEPKHGIFKLEKHLSLPVGKKTVTKGDVITKTIDPLVSREDRIIKALAEYSGKNIDNKTLSVVSASPVQQNIFESAPDIIYKGPASNETSKASVRYCDIQLTEKKLPAVYGYLNSPLVSLEIATEPILHLVDNLKRFVNIAKQHCTRATSSDAGLTHDESAAIYLYTMEMGDSSFYRILNKALRSENRPALKPWFYYLKLLDNALNKLKPQKIVTWRGMYTDVSKNFKKDDKIVWWSINSCSSSVDIIKDFLGTNSTLFLIECVNGKDISSYTAYPSENEILLMSGTCLEVVSDPLNLEGTLNIVHLRETDTNYF